MNFCLQTRTQGQQIKTILNVPAVLDTCIKTKWFAVKKNSNFLDQIDVCAGKVVSWLAWMHTYVSVHG